MLFPHAYRMNAAVLSALLHIIQEFVVVFPVDIGTQRKRNQRIRSPEQMELRGWNHPVEYDLAEISNVQIDRVCQKQQLNFVAESFNGIKDCGHPHQELRDNPPEILHIPEEHEKRGEYHAHADIEADKASNRIQQRQKLPSKGHAVDRGKDKEQNKRQAKVDE